MRFDEHPDRNCAGGDIDRWFPPRSDIAATRAATKLCHGCPVIEECLRFALKTEWSLGQSSRDGIFGGTTPAQRFGLEVKIRGRKPPRTVRGPHPIKHGTNSGYVLHKNRKQEACGACKAAHREYQQQRSARGAARGAVA
jgi:hypothetical protein